MVNRAERIRSLPRGAAGDVPAPQIYHYLDYRAFLRDYYRYRKARNARFSFRRLARDAGLNSHSLIKMVMTGDRNLSEASATQLGKGCGLSGNELSYFLAVVQWNQCTSVDVRETYWQQILRRKPRVPFHELRANQLE